LPQRVVPPLDMGSQAGLFASGGVLLEGDHQLVRFPEITVAMTAFVSSRDALPQLLTSGLAAITDDVGHDLASRATQRNPNSTLARLFQDK